MTEKATLTSSEALAAMHRFLEMYWERGQSEEIGIILGSLSVLPDGKCADPAMWDDWIQCVKEVVEARHKSQIK